MKDMSMKAVAITLQEEDEATKSILEQIAMNSLAQIQQKERPTKRQKLAEKIKQAWLKNKISLVESDEDLQAEIMKLKRRLAVKNKDLTDMKDAMTDMLSQVQKAESTM